MIIEKNNVVAMDYTLKDDEGNIVDSSNGQQPLEFLCGYQNIIPGLEKALIGKAVGDSIKVSVAPNEAYGDYEPTLVQIVNKNQIDSDDKIEVGTHFQVDTEEGPMIYTVIKVEGENITLDGNHPLAGQTLHFEVEIKAIRESSKEEQEHGHIHSADGCQ